jgi:UDP-glucose 4-epimerase
VRVLVTGARGFIGATLVPRLRERKIEIIPYNGDVKDIASFASPSDIVIHLAAKPVREESTRSGVEAMRANIIGIQAVTEYARRFSGGIVFASTCAVYGATAENRHLKEDDPLCPRGLNGIGKLLSEEMLSFAAGLHGFGAIILRLFNVYGVGQPRGYLVSDLIHSLTVREPMRLRNPRAILDFIHVDDVCEAIRMAIPLAAGGGTQIFNIGTGKGTAVTDVARMLFRLAGTRQEVIEEGLPGEEIRVVADPSAAGHRLKWRARLDLATGLAETLPGGEQNR